MMVIGTTGDPLSHMPKKTRIHILPVHYYSPVPNTAELTPEIWTSRESPVGVDLRIDYALIWLRKLSEKYAEEYKSFSRTSANPGRFQLNNAAFSSGDAEVLYAIIRDVKPRRIVEVGSGNSTLLICDAIRRNQQELSAYRCDFCAIEPFPPSYLDRAPSQITRFERTTIQRTPLALFETLEANDLLFINSRTSLRLAAMSSMNI